MRNFSFIFLVSIFFLLSCSNVKKDEIPLFNNVYFKTLAGEKSAEINPTIKENYPQYLSSDKIQIPIFKYFKHPKYEIYIGIPYNTSIKQIIQERTNSADSLSLTYKIDSLTYYKSYEYRELFITEYAREITGKGLIYVTTISYSKDIADSVFSFSAISDRLILK